MLEIIDKKGISDPKLEHIFLGTVKSNNVSGYHCKRDLGDENAYAEAPLYPKSHRVITANKNQKVFEAYVRERKNFRLKSDNNGKSTFFNQGWTRQEVIDCISRAKTKKIKEYGLNGDVKNVHVDRVTGLVIVDCKATSFPLLRY